MAVAVPKLGQLVSAETLQAILSDFIETTGIVVSAMDLEGNWLTHTPGKMTDHCEIIHKTPAGKAACLRSDKELVAEVNQKRRYALRCCHAGLYDFAAPILVEDEVVGYIVGGQVLGARLTEEQIVDTISRLDLDEDAYRRALAQLPFLSAPRIESLVRLLQAMSSSIADAAYHQQEQEARAEELAELVRSLSTPVIQVWEQVLALPLIGPVNEERARLITERLLEGITHYRASIAILDITGVPVVDTHVVQSILQAARAASLLGAVCILSGIRPEVAQTIVSLGLNLGDIPVSANLQEGIRLALELRAQ